MLSSLALEQLDSASKKIGSQNASLARLSNRKCDRKFDFAESSLSYFGSFVARRAYAFLTLIFTVILSSLSGNPLPAQSLPPYNNYLGVAFDKKPSDSGVPILMVVADSPAEGAGLKEGDILKAVDGRPVTSNTRAYDLISFHPPFDPVPIQLDVERDGKPLRLAARPTGYVRFDNLTPQKLFFKPGIDHSSPFEPSNPVLTLDSINVLDRIVLDPTRGSIEFIGRYDPTYATGPIPYRQLLDAAIKFPAPGFSLDPIPQTFTHENELKAKFKADLESIYGPNSNSNLRRGWYNRWTNLLLGHPLLEVERQLYLERLAEVAGLSKQELIDLFNYVNFGNMTWSVPANLLESQIKLLKAVGFGECAEAYSLFRQDTMESALAAAEKLGQADEAAQLLNQPDVINKNEAEKIALLQGFVVFRMARELMILSDKLAAERFEQFRGGSATIRQLDIWFQQFLLPINDSTGFSLPQRALSGFPLSNELLGMFYGIQIPQANLRFDDMDGATALGRVFYEADYALKTLDLAEEIFQTIPEHKALAQIRFEEKSRAGTITRCALFPEIVEVLASKDSKEISFGSVIIKLEVECKQSYTGDAPATASELATGQRAAETYKAQIDQNFEQYARNYPEFHQLRETAKLIAFARWLKQQQIKLAPEPKVTPVRGWGEGEKAWVPPKQVPILYVRSMRIEDVTLPDGKRIERCYFDRTGWTGGVDFGKKQNWVSVSPIPPSSEPIANSLTTSAALGQAAVEAALAGDLESARDLAEQSARSMQGEIDISRVPPNIKIPSKPVPGLAAPSSIRLVKEAIQYVHSLNTTDAAGNSGASISPNQRALLTNINRELEKASSGAPVASDFLYQLQTRQTLKNDRLSRLEGMRSGIKGPAPSDPRVPSFCEKYRATMAATNDLGPERTKFYHQQLAEMRQNLERVQQAMANIEKLNRQDLKELEKWEKEINKGYSEAQDRLLDAVGLLLVDSPLGILEKRREEVRQSLNSAMYSSMIARKFATSPEQARELNESAFTMLKLKYHTESIFNQAEHLQKQIDQSKLVYDAASWAASDKEDFDRVKEGILMLTELLIKEPKLGGKLNLGGVTSEKLLHWLSLYKAVTISAGFLGDIVAQQLAWEPVIEQLEKSISQHRKALEQLRQRANELREKIQCLEAFSTG